MIKIYMIQVRRIYKNCASNKPLHMIQGIVGTKLNSDGNQQKNMLLIVAPIGATTFTIHASIIYIALKIPI